MRSTCIAAVFGVGAVADAYNYAYIIPGFLLVLLGSINSPLHSALVSVLAKRDKSAAAPLVETMRRRNEEINVDSLGMEFYTKCKLCDRPVILVMGSKRKSPGYWEDFSNLERELLDFIEIHGTLGIMPTQDNLSKASRSDLVNAIRKHGGYLAVAQRLGLELSSTRKPLGYWDNFSNLKSELLTFTQEQGTLGVMPTIEELRQAKRHDLANAIAKQGGYSVVAERLGLKWFYTRKSPAYWHDFANVERELVAFINEYGTLGIMPTKEELKKAGRSDLESAVNKHGGFSVVAERLGLELTYAKKTLGYWKDFSNLERELLAFIKEYGASGIIPTYTELRKAERYDLANAINKNGGYSAVAKKTGLGVALHSKRLLGGVLQPKA